MYIVINGGGKVASALASTLINKGHNVAIIEKRVDVAKRLSFELTERALIIVGDGCDVPFQDAAGVARADVFVAATGDDDDNLVACQLAKVAFDVPRTISRVNNPKNQRIFNALDIEAISSTQIISRMIEEETTTGDFHIIKTLKRGNLVLVEILIHADSVVNGKKIGDIKVPAKVKLVAVIHSEKDNDDVDLATPETELSEGDIIIALADPKQERALEKAINGE